MLLWSYDLIPAFCLVAFIGYIVSVRLELFAQFGVEALASNMSDDSIDALSATSEEGGKNLKFWKKLRSDAIEQPYYGFSVLKEKSMNDWRSDIKSRYGPTGQLMVCTERKREKRRVIGSQHTHGLYLADRPGGPTGTFQKVSYRLTAFLWIHTN